MVSTLQVLPTTVKLAAERRDRAIHAKYDMPTPSATLTNTANAASALMFFNAVISSGSLKSVNTNGKLANKFE
eukprot:CAMPEP_0184437944 /NCGR_PEP_ID=MMETSP0738-20130409/624788_1 /TAXON_ID=385413 /ORGANISM="Thalassiosira miniscula, Strain CCMP1093" /LENGTH=72 /DNA_ID=CAMNT_0026805111 /DNA_START=224 /DNA_END=442 /DNA_ORIENTATION=+